MRKVNRLTGPAKSPWDERPIALVAAAIETESDPLSPRGAGRKVRRPPGGVADHQLLGDRERLHRFAEEAINVVADPLGADDPLPGLALRAGPTS
jgi:hypothetical protein